MGLLRKNRKHKHHWSIWKTFFTGGDEIQTRSCRCAAVQRHNITTGEITIWTPDGIDSGLLDRGITRQIYEELDNL